MSPFARLPFSVFDDPLKHASVAVFDFAVDVDRVAIWIEVAAKARAPQNVTPQSGCYGCASVIRELAIVTSNIKAREILARLDHEIAERRHLRLARKDVVRFPAFDKIF